ncbi:MAG TPA: cyclic nucleotide-binding domain-containing protein [Stellaceae bacterium]|nr:cyclic nucleotide-binding domain-containing protein [Stellaceae bacterium]
MSLLEEIVAVGLLGLATTCSALAGAAIGLYLPISKRLLAAILAFSAGALISALAIELAFEGAVTMHLHGYGATGAWAFVGGGFAIGAGSYYSAALFLEWRGAAVRYQTRFREYANDRKRRECKSLIALLAKNPLLRHLPAEEIERILPCVNERHLEPDDVLFRAGDPGDALYIVARGKVRVLAGDASHGERLLAELGEGQALGEMALLSGGIRTATVRAAEPTDLLRIDKADFSSLIDADPRMAEAVDRLSHDRAVSNLSAGGTDAATWAKIANSSLDHLSRQDANRFLAEAGRGAGLAIVLGNVLDTIPGCLVIGAKFDGVQNLALTLMIGMFLGGIPEAAASATMLRKAGFTQRAVFGLWSTVLVAGVVAAIAGKLMIASSDSPIAIFSQAVAGGAVLALVAHAMIPESIEAGGSVVVLPIVGGFLFALYLALTEALV